MKQPYPIKEKKGLKMKHLSFGMILLLFTYCTTSQIRTVKNSFCEGTWEGSTDVEKMDIKEKMNREFEWRDKTPERAYVYLKSISEQDYENFESLVKNERPCNSYLNYYAIKLYAGKLIKEKKTKDAADIWRKYKEYFPQKKLDIEELIALIEKQELETIKITNLGTNVNSNSGDYIPILELNGKKMYFTSDRFGSEDVFQTEYDTENKTWKKSEPVKDLNSKSEEAPIGVSNDGKKIILFGNYNIPRPGHGDMFFSNLTKDGWGKVQAFPEPVNSKYYDSDGFFSSDGKVLLFTSDRPNSPYTYHEKDEYYAADYGGNIDIYVAFADDNGVFTKVINLGTMINTSGSERMPFLHTDGKTLYFSSDGHNGFGGLDLFKTVRLDDTWTKWSKPVNLGKLVNNTGEDWGFKLSASAGRAYFSGELADTHGGQDIYVMEPLPESFKPETTAVAYTGKLFDQNKNPLEADITWRSKKDPTITGKTSSKPNTGEYYYTLIPDHDYEITVKKDEKVLKKEEVTVAKETKFEEKKQDIDVNIDKPIVTTASTRPTKIDEPVYTKTIDACNPSGLTMIQGKTKIQLMGDDSHSGLSYLEYSINGSQSNIYTSPFTLPKEGYYSIKLRSVDKVGNTESYKECKFLVDNSPPMMKLDSKNSTKGVSYLSPNQPIHFHSEDALSGVASQEYSINGSEFKSYTGDILLTQLGLNTLRIKSTDKVGNSDTKEFSGFYLDNQPPEVKIESSLPMKTIDQKLYIPIGTKFEIKANDSESGLAKIYYKINNDETFKEYIEKFQFYTSGEHHIQAYAIDKAGNKSKIVEFRAFMDIKSPNSNTKLQKRSN